MLRDGVIALSLSNLCFINAWRSLLIPASFFYYYHQKTLPPPVQYLSLVSAVILLGIFLFTGIRVIRGARNPALRRWGEVLFLLILSVPLYGVLTQLDNNTVLRLLAKVCRNDAVARQLLPSIILATVLFLMLLAFLKMKVARRLGVIILLVLAPLLPITFIQAFLVASKYQASDEMGPAIHARLNNNSPRILWIVFDEFDFRVAFAERPKTVLLPELDRLAAESLFANNAYPPAGETLLSMPALITGKLISEAHREGPDKLMIKFGDDQPAVSWATQPSIFSDAQAAGFNTALFGWYHPYCRILGRVLTNCDWEGQMSGPEIARVLRGGSAVPANNLNGFGSSLAQHAAMAAFTIPLVAPVFRPSLDIAELERKKDVLDFQDTYRWTIKAANNPNSGIVFSHWALPHPPNIYDRSEHQISASANHSYLDNLALLDETLGKIRQAMEAAGTWEHSVILITSDHWWRPMWRHGQYWTSEDESIMGTNLDRRIPFILKMPGDTEAVRYDSPFNTVLSHDLLLAILKGEVKDTKEVVRWLDQHRSIGRSPYDERSFS